MEKVDERLEPAAIDEADGRGSVNSTAHAYQQVRAAILSGRLPPGEVFSQVRLADQLGISRTPLREALRLLQTEGLIEAEERRRVRVAELDPSDLDALYAMRILVEPLGVFVSVPKLDEADLEEIASAHAEVVAGLERRAYQETREPHRRFHFGLFKYAPHRLHRSIADLWDHAERYRLLYSTSAEDQLAMAMLASSEHRAILAAAERHDAQQCHRLIARHLSRTVLTLFATEHQQYEPVSVRQALLLTDARQPE
jgi:DNA-binding GntR family transcriptional regulator